MRQFLSSDGEAIILKEAYSPEVQAAMSVNCIDMAKNAPSADRMSVFKDVKHMVKTGLNSSKDMSNSIVEANLKGLLLL